VSIPKRAAPVGLSVVSIRLTFGGVGRQFAEGGRTSRGVMPHEAVAGDARGGLL
jgi:hypothetical protein